MSPQTVCTCLGESKKSKEGLLPAILYIPLPHPNYTRTHPVLTSFYGAYHIARVKCISLWGLLIERSRDRREVKTKMVSMLKMKLKGQEVENEGLGVGGGRGWGVDRFTMNGRKVDVWKCSLCASICNHGLILLQSLHSYTSFQLLVQRTMGSFRTDITVV